MSKGIRGHRSASAAGGQSVGQREIYGAAYKASIKNWLASVRTIILHSTGLRSLSALYQGCMHLEPGSAKAPRGDTKILGGKLWRQPVWKNNMMRYASSLPSAKSAVTCSTTK